MPKSKVIYVNHRTQKCGVYEFGRTIGAVLVRSEVFDIVYSECDSWEEFKKIYDTERPDAVIYNYHPSTMPWISRRSGLKGPQSYCIDAIQIGTIHEAYQEAVDSATDLVFDYHIAPDPTLILKNPIVYKTGRLVRRFNVEHNINDIITVGSFGFATNGKGFGRIVDIVQSEFDEAVININISFAKFGDEDGSLARNIAQNLRSRITKQGIRLNVTHHHFSEDELVHFLARNDLNAFLYDYAEKRGIASTTEWALSARRPLAITKSSMFRHLFMCYPSICIEDNSLRAIITNGTAPTEQVYEDWCQENLLWDYERIIADVFRQDVRKPKAALATRRLRFLLNLFQLQKNRLRCSSVWITTQMTCGFSGFAELEYTPVELEGRGFNRILDNQARALYASPIQFLQSLVPEVMRNKIAEANVQQGFVFDTAYRLARQLGKKCRMLAVGAFENTAFLALQKLGFSIEGIDPNLNYDLATFITRPTVHPASYDLIISTSVIEHIPDDEHFVRDIAYLIKPGGIAILTCDFHNSYSKGFEIPSVDCRFYTKSDITDRLMKAVPNCSLYGGVSQWDCSEYDFWYDNRRYNYTFASIVFIKEEVLSS